MYWTIGWRVLDLNDFFYFVQVVDRGGFTAAGRTLRIQKSTLSHRIQQLENALGVSWLTGRLIPDHKTIADFRKDSGLRRSVCMVLSSPGQWHACRRQARGSEQRMALPHAHGLFDEPSLSAVPREQFWLVLGHLNELVFKHTSYASPSGRQTVVRAACPHDCPDTCAMLVTVEDGRAVAVRGDPDHPFTRGGLCVKVNNYEQRVYSPDRVLYPSALRTEGTGQFNRISWDEAMEVIRDRWTGIAGILR